MQADGPSEPASRAEVRRYVLQKVSPITLRTLLSGDIDEKVVSNEYGFKRVASLKIEGHRIRVEYQAAGQETIAYQYLVQELRLVPSGIFKKGNKV